MAQPRDAQCRSLEGLRRNWPRSAAEAGGGDGACSRDAEVEMRLISASKFACCGRVVIVAQFAVVFPRRATLGRRGGVCRVTCGECNGSVGKGS